MAAPDWTVIDPIARTLGVTEHALEGWHTRGYVPALYRLPMVQAGLPLDTDFGDSPRRKVRSEVTA